MGPGTRNAICGIFQECHPSAGKWYLAASVTVTSICGIRYGNFITSRRSISLTPVCESTQEDETCQPVLLWGQRSLPKTVCQHPGARRGSHHKSEAVSVKYLLFWACFSFFQTCHYLGMTLYDCDSQVKCEVVSYLSSSSLDDSLAPKKGEENWVPFSHSWWDLKNEKKNIYTKYITGWTGVPCSRPKRIEQE